MGNFDFLKLEPKFKDFADIAILAENLMSIDNETAIINCRRAMEFAIKWLYSVDRDLVLPWNKDKLVGLMNTEEFKDIVGKDLWIKLELIRKLGNNIVHTRKKVTNDEATLCLKNLFDFMDFVSCCYADNYSRPEFNPNLIGKGNIKKIDVSDRDIDVEALIKENAKLRKELTSKREKQRKQYVPRPLELSEYATRKIYIDTMLNDAGWIENENWKNEIEVKGMPNKSGVGFIDYVLYGDDGKALAIIEAKRTCKNVEVGRQQAKLYADLIEKKQGRRPIIFLTNGFETRIIDNQYRERNVASIYSKRDLEKLFNLRSMKKSLDNIMVDENIANRYYQKGAIKAVCDAFGKKNRRKALLVMATGSGKTRTVIALCKILLQKGWVRNILFLADRNALVTQAKRSFTNLLPSLALTNLCEEKNNYGAHGVFSTYKTMMNCIDSVSNDEGSKLFTIGHFDLVICDEAHRSIYNKYKEIFNYFDAPLVGLTATPKDEIDKNTYEIFDLENGIPTYGYDLAQAVKDGYLVDYVSIETTLKFMQQGISYEDLSEDEKRVYEETFSDEDGKMSPIINATELNKWIFNEDTIKQVLRTLMNDGLKIDYGSKIGKTIIFARNHNHAEKILEVFEKEYPNLIGYAKVIDNHINYSQSAIDEFSDPDKLPQIAISVDMLDTGIDVPEILNLVFFKKVMSKAKFWQMIGRGTRLCPNLLDGKDKEKFYIFDFCGNFDFFRLNKGKATKNQLSIQGSIFSLEFDIAFKLQDIAYQTDDLIAFRASLVESMVNKVRKLDKSNFAVKQHLKYVEMYSNPESYKLITYENTLDIKRELAPLIEPEDDNAIALRFDALMYGIELAYLMNKKDGRRYKDLKDKVKSISKIANIPEIIEQKDIINKILNTDYLNDDIGINKFEDIRERLRNLMKYIPKSQMIFETDFNDEILSKTWNESDLENDDLKNYKEKAEYYIRQHQNEKVISKIKTNQPLTNDDIKDLERILWNELGTQEDYKKEYKDKPLGEFVREIVGLDMNAAKQAFSKYLNETNLDSRQIYFVNKIIEYIVQNGMMKDLSVLQETPFTDKGSVIDIFPDISVFAGIKTIIQQINSNAFIA